MSITELESRLGLYRFFNRLLSKEIDQHLLDELRKPDFAKAINQLGICLDEPASDGDLFLEQSAIEFTRLFLGPGKHISPHESVQIGQDGTLNDGTTVRVRQFIEATGFQFKADSKKIPDHICSELEFMEALISREIGAIEDGDSEEAETSKILQEEFLQRHLKLWVPKFGNKIEQSAKLPLYKSLGRAISAFIQIEKGNRVTHQDQAV